MRIIPAKLTEQCSPYFSLTEPALRILPLIEIIFAPSHFGHSIAPTSLRTGNVASSLMEVCASSVHGAVVSASAEVEVASVFNTGSEVPKTV